MRKFLILFLWTLLFCPVSSLQAQDNSALEEGLKALREGRLTESLRALDRQKLKTPQDARPYFFSGLVLYQTGQPLQALKELEKAVELDPANLKYRILYADLLFKSDFKYKAVEVIEPLQDQSKVNTLLNEEIWVVQDIFFQMGQYEDSLTAVQVYEERDPDNDALYFRKAQLYMGLNDLDNALQAFEAALERTEKKADAYYGIGLIQFQKGNMEESSGALEKAIGLKAGDPEFIHLYASTLIALKKPEEALEYLVRIEDQADQYPKIYDAMARSYRLMRDVEKARLYTRKFAQLDSKNKRIEGKQQEIHRLIQEGQRLLKEGQREQAVNSFNQVLALEPDHYIVNNTLAGMYVLEQNWDKAYQHLSLMLEKHPDAFETNFLTANYYYYRRQYSEALKYGQKALSLRPGFAELRNLLGNTYFALGDKVKAKEEYGAAMKLDPDKAAYRLNFESIP